MSRTTYSFPDKCRAESICCNSCYSRFNESVSLINLENGKTRRLNHWNKIWNKDCSFFQRELPRDHPVENKHFEVYHINPEVDHLLDPTLNHDIEHSLFDGRTIEVIPALHAIMINQFTTLRLTQSFVKNLQMYIIYEVHGDQRTIIESQQWGKCSK